MQSLKFKQLLLISNSTRSANQFDFPKRMTIITADDNNYGKSTLAKLLLWSLGCDPEFDTTWQSLDCKTILRFSIDSKEYETMRYKDIICLNESNIIELFPKITGRYAERIAEILNFYALLPNRHKIVLETPPPAYYFVPYYIDQKKSWSAAWENFAKLEQYANWKSTIIKYHIGLLPKKHFELETEKYGKKQEESDTNLQLDRINTTLEVVADFIPASPSTISQERLQNITKEIREDLKVLSEFQEKTLDELTGVESEKVFLLHQQSISKKIIADLDKDYNYSVEYFDNDTIECPLCGTHHDNSIISRTSILTDKQQAENQLAEIDKDLGKCEAKLEKLRIKLDKARQDINAIHSKYIIEEDDQPISLNDIIENIAGAAIQNNVKKSRSTILEALHKLTKDIKDINQEQKTVLSEEERNAIYSSFTTILASYIELLNAEDINTSLIKSPLDYAKIVKEGGAAEGTRGILAYYLTIFSLITKYSDQVISPIIIDTPNQQEQSEDNYERILLSISEKIPSSSQIILCALQNHKLEKIKAEANVINLTKERLLSADKYDEVLKEFAPYNIDELLKANVNDDEEEDVDE